jgi:hypothetical protein
VQLALPAHLDFQPLGQGVDRRYADAVQAAGHLVRAAAELAAGMQLGHHRFKRRFARLLVDADRDAAAPVLYGHAAVFADRNRNPVTVAGHRLVDRVIHHFRYHVVEGLDICPADVHAGAAAHGLQPFEHLNIISGIMIGPIISLFCHVLTPAPTCRRDVPPERLYLITLRAVRNACSSRRKPL